jgi:hypothetical protein
MFANTAWSRRPLQEELNLISKGQRKMLAFFLLPESF